MEGKRVQITDKYLVWNFNTLCKHVLADSTAKEITKYKAWQELTNLCSIIAHTCDINNGARRTRDYVLVTDAVRWLAGEWNDDYSLIFKEIAGYARSCTPNNIITGFQPIIERRNALCHDMGMYFKQPKTDISNDTIASLRFMFNHLCKWLDCHPDGVTPEMFSSVFIKYYKTFE